MVTVTTIAQKILDENKYTTSDMSLSNLENNIDNVIDYVNLETGASIAYLTGSADSKSLVCDRKYIPPIKLLSTLMIRAALDRGPNVSVASIGVNIVVADPQYNLFMRIVERSLARCRGGYFSRT